MAKNRTGAASPAGERASTRNVPVDGSAGEDAGIAAHVARYAEAAGPVANRAVGSITDSGERGEDCGDRPADGLIADAYQAQASAAMDEPVDLALVNSGGVRTDLSGAADGVLTFGELAAMAPFGNSVLVLEMTGAEIEAVLEQQFCAENGVIGVCDSILIPSASLAYRVDLTRPLGQNVVDIMLDGEPIDPAATYRLATNNFLAGGGDGFTLFTQASTIANTGFDIDGLEAYVARGDLSVPVSDRVPGSAPVGWSLSQRRLVKAAQLAAVEAVAFLAQQRQRFDADAQMLADRTFVEGIGLPRQLDLAMQRLVADA